MIEKVILSPITHNTNITKIKSFDVDWIIDEWEKSYSYDVRYLFKDIEKIDLYKCNDTGYNFFYPFISGDPLLYQHLQENKWYYMPWKWEHEESTKYLKKYDHVLEIGCAEGHYLDKIKNNFRIEVTGIETNPGAVKKMMEKNITVYQETILEHSLIFKDKYDVICSFQVLEHITDISSFFESCLTCLKPNGLLIISVPNNRSFISDTIQILNMPPHHVGLWDENSLRSIAKIYGLELAQIVFEPLQSHHLSFFKEIVYSNILGDIYKNRIFRKIYNLFILKPFVDKHIEYVTKWIPGHTIMSIYRKKVAS
jgi:2-polyprenyl-3-methyl-5-hydroxy-6-metoxy-1,4-benzoquinol methylase